MSSGESVDIPENNQIESANYPGLTIQDFLISEGTIESGVYSLILYNDALSNRSGNSIPLPIQFIYDTIAPQFLTENDYSSLGRDGYGHEYFHLDQFKHAYVDNFITDDDYIYFNNSTVPNYSNITNLIDVLKTISETLSCNSLKALESKKSNESITKGKGVIKES